MKIIYLLRHADAQFSSDISDIDRLLSTKGEEDAKALSNLMEVTSYQPDFAYCSPARRTKQTFNLLNLSVSAINTDQKLYLGTSGDYLNYLINTDNKYNNILLVGHNPSIHQTARFLGQKSDDIRLIGYNPCTLTVLNADIKNWNDLSPEFITIEDIIVTQSH